MALLNLFSLYIVFFLLLFFFTKGTTLGEPASLSSASSDVELLRGKIRGSLQGNTENLLLSIFMECFCAFVPMEGPQMGLLQWLPFDLQ
jgi:hypothetical protein